MEMKRILGMKTEGIDVPVADGSLDESTLASSIDWRTRNAVNAVKDQGACGSCWSFATAASLEGAYSVLSGSLQLYSISEQQFLDCDRYDSGCNGGNPVLAYRYSMEAGVGNEEESSYPYLATDGHLCAFDKTKAKVKVTSYVQVPSGSASELKSAINVGPVTVGVEAD